MNSISVTFQRNLKCFVCHLLPIFVIFYGQINLEQFFFEKTVWKKCNSNSGIVSQNKFFFSFFFTKNKWNLRWVNIKNQVLLIMPDKKIVSRKFFSRGATRYVQNRLRLKSDPCHFRLVSRFWNLFVKMCLCSARRRW